MHKGTKLYLSSHPEDRCVIRSHGSPALHASGLSGVMGVAGSSRDSGVCAAMSLVGSFHTDRVLCMLSLYRRTWPMCSRQQRESIKTPTVLSLSKVMRKTCTYKPQVTIHSECLSLRDVFSATADTATTQETLSMMSCFRHELDHT